eukprot:EG_transcript_8864
MFQPPLSARGPAGPRPPIAPRRRVASVRYWYENDGVATQPVVVPSPRYSPSPEPLSAGLSPGTAGEYRSSRVLSLPLSAAGSVGSSTPGVREVVRGSRLVDVPSTRTVATPIFQEKVVTTMRRQAVPTTQLVQDVQYVTREEPYVEYENRPAVRMKEVWVRQVVPETVYETVPVQRVRQVTVPQPVTREVTCMTEVEVPVQEVVQEPCYRIDEVHEVAQAEVQVFQEVEWVPRVVAQWEDGERLVSDWRATHQRTVGFECVPRAAPPDAGGAHRVFAAPLPPLQPTHYGGVPYSASRPSPFRHVISEGETLVTPSEPTVPPPPPPASRPAKGTSAQPAPPPFRVHLGLSLQQAGNNLVIKDIAAGGLAEAAGLHAGDVLIAVDGGPVVTHEDFQAQIRGKAHFEVDVFDERHQQYHKHVIDATTAS